MSANDPASYGDAFADVYDDWYGDLPGLDAAVELLARFAGGGRALELGVGTGRIALALAARGVAVVGVDASEAMLARLRAKPGADAVELHLADMSALDANALLSAGGAFAVVYVAINTLFNVSTLAGQEACITAVANLLVPGGHFVVEAFVPRDPSGDQTGDPSGDLTGDATSETDHVSVRSVEQDRVVLTVSRTDHRTQVTTGSHVELSNEGGVRLRPWTIRWMTPAQLDALCADRHLVLQDRYSGWAMEGFDEHSTSHISVYRR